MNIFRACAMKICSLFVDSAIKLLAVPLSAFVLLHVVLIFFSFVFLFGFYWLHDISIAPCTQRCFLFSLIYKSQRFNRASCKKTKRFVYCGGLPYWIMIWWPILSILYIVLGEISPSTFPQRSFNSGKWRWNFHPIFNSRLLNMLNFWSSLGLQRVQGPDVNNEGGHHTTPYLIELHSLHMFFLLTHWILWKRKKKKKMTLTLTSERWPSNWVVSFDEPKSTATLAQVFYLILFSCVL